MTATAQEYTELFTRLLNLEEDIKEANGVKKEALELFSERTGVSVKSLKKSFASYKEYLKNATEFHLVDGETEQILTALIGVREV